MAFNLKPFPTEVSDYIELPTMAELLTYSPFFNGHADDFRRIAPPFLKWLLDQVPLRNDKKYVTVLSQVRFMKPDLRSCTSRSMRIPDEWHIDTEFREIFDTPTDRIHLLQSETTSMTEFNKNEVFVDYDHQGKTIEEFCVWVQDNWKRIGVTPEKAPANRIVTFDNHLHRATDPKQIEFKFMFRVVETDRTAPPDTLDKSAFPMVYAHDHNNNLIPNIERPVGKVVIHLPSIHLQDLKQPPQK